METNQDQNNTAENPSPSPASDGKVFEKDIGAVWVKKSQGGAQFLSFTIDLNQFGINQKVNLVGFKNKNKKEPKHPDFRIFPSNREAAVKPAQAATPVADVPDLDI